jgi:hypothetical protein
MGPAVAQFESVSHTKSEFVEALASSVLGATLVSSVKLACPGIARPESSDAVQLTMMLFGCQTPSAAFGVQLIVGAAVSGGIGVHAPVSLIVAVTFSVVSRVSVEPSPAFVPVER